MRPSPSSDPLCASSGAAVGCVSAQRISPLRHVVESLILLAVAVTMFRSFLAEGYLISTGSMAPTLLGYHRRVHCPDCHYLFARGAAFDRDVTQASDTVLADLGDTELTYTQANCPNCGRTDIASWQVPKNEGDQLLVHKHAYEWRDPRRWEVIVFRNPADQRQAYVKRVAGLPGEELLIRNGEIFANGELCRKPFETQKAVRILVSDASHDEPHDDQDWQHRWNIGEESQWSRQGNSFKVSPSDSGETDWIEYRHWIRSGGSHETIVPLDEWPRGEQHPNPSFENIVYAYPSLIATGVFSSVDRDRWRTRSDDADFQMALDHLFEESHIAPVTDQYGYNSPETNDGFLVNDFMVSLTLSEVSGPGGFAVHLDAGEHEFLAVFDLHERKIELLMDQDPNPIHSLPMPEECGTEETEIDFSCFDSQVVVAINGATISEPFQFERSSAPVEVRFPTRIGAVGMSALVKNLRLYRDVYYTPKPGTGPREFAVDDDAFFVVGDNSPVSVDSRVWDDPNVPRDSLIGKPIVVHLPSKQGQLQWKGQTRYFRIPDFSRVRYVR